MSVCRKARATQALAVGAAGELIIGGNTTPGGKVGQRAQVETAAASASGAGGGLALRGTAQALGRAAKQSAQRTTGY